MKQKTYTKVSGVIFGVVAIVHLIRVLSGWQFMIGSYDVPAVLSIVAFVVLGYLAYSAYKLSK